MWYQREEGNTAHCGGLTRVPSELPGNRTTFLYSLAKANNGSKQKALLSHLSNFDQIYFRKFRNYRGTKKIKEEEKKIREKKATIIVYESLESLGIILPQCLICA